ncbi:hypothetical protein AJ80_02170 [Polytolypa hystricis UAMH7299]|uniref:PQ loop repeat protein n=1 Tax=Polytolypa hystricis (strain UAMH7299) TaxID=1447883 RepID=A0A2B7YRR0_POLH7|nr:hypothetical protein AJ80_02170 [Polytolypa hystricis UAMH7299]
MDVPIAANILGTTGAVCWSIQLIPQIIVNYRRHHTKGLQSSMMMLWATAGVPLGVYNIVEDFNLALKIQPQILTALSLLTWAQCMYYAKCWAVRKCFAATATLAVILGGIQAALIFALRIAKDRELSWPLTLMAVLSACLLAAGVIRHYWDIYVHRTVRGISFLFVAIDAAGDLFSILSIVFQRKLDILGIIIYGTELVLWIGILACGAVYNFLPWMMKREKREQDIVEEPVSLHPMPSSTSVFRTASCDGDSVTRRVVSHD